VERDLSLIIMHLSYKYYGVKTNTKHPQKNKSLVFVL
jgi:hypothetical protein